MNKTRLTNSLTRNAAALERVLPLLGDGSHATEEDFANAGKDLTAALFDAADALVDAAQVKEITDSVTRFRAAARAAFSSGYYSAPRPILRPRAGEASYTKDPAKRDTLQEAAAVMIRTARECADTIKNTNR